MLNSNPTIADYIKAQRSELQPILQKIYSIVKSAAPEATEGISYGMPAFKLRGKPLIYFAGFKSHIGLYPPVPAAFTKRVAKYAGPKGNLQFPLAEPIPYQLIQEIVEYKVAA